jgi:hypothetical protein
MTVQLAALCIAALDPPALARFWSEVLGREATGEDALLADGPAGFPIRFVPTREPKTAQNFLHFDLTSTSLEDQRATVARALELGGRHADVGQRPDELHVVLADPEGNEFCVIEPGNAFLAGCGFLGALACDGSQEVGYFWSRALAWPLVWDQDLETAVQAPYGGPKISWGGTAPTSGPGTRRWSFELAVPVGADLDDEVARLVGLGATRGDPEPDREQVRMTDPDGTAFRVVLPR